MRKFILSIFFLLLPNIVSATDSLIEIETLKQLSVNSAIEGCYLAIAEGQVTGYMKRAEQVEKPIASREIARKELLESNIWKEKFAPAMKKMCECTLEEPISLIKKSKDKSALEIAITKLQEYPKQVKDSKEFEIKALRCMEQYVNPILKEVTASKGNANFLK